MRINPIFIVPSVSERFLRGSKTILKNIPCGIHVFRAAYFFCTESEHIEIGAVYVKKGT